MLRAVGHHLSYSGKGIHTVLPDAAWRYNEGVNKNEKHNCQANYLTYTIDVAIGSSAFPVQQIP